MAAQRDEPPRLAAEGSQAIMPDQLLTTRELSERLQLDRITIYRLVKEGELPALRVGGQWRFSANAIDAWLQRHDREPSRPPATPPDTPSDLSLSDLIPIQTIQSIQDRFASILGVSSFVTNQDGQPLMPCRRCSRFCQLVHTTETGMAGCQTSWRSVAQSTEQGACIHTCHAGIQYASAPVEVNGRRLGMVTAGQFLTQPPNAEAFRAQALATGERIGVAGEALADAMDSIEIVGADRALQITELLAVIANALSNIGYESYLARQTLARIALLTAEISIHPRD